MLIQMHPTDTLSDVDGVVCQLWNGVTQTGIGVGVFVHQIFIVDAKQVKQFKREWVKTSPRLKRRMVKPEAGENLISIKPDDKLTE